MKIWQLRESVSRIEINVAHKILHRSSWNSYEAPRSTYSTFSHWFHAISVARSEDTKCVKLLSAWPSYYYKGSGGLSAKLPSCKIVRAISWLGLKNVLFDPLSAPTPSPLHLIALAKNKKNYAAVCQQRLQVVEWNIIRISVVW